MSTKNKQDIELWINGGGEVFTITRTRDESSDLIDQQYGADAKIAIVDIPSLNQFMQRDTEEKDELQN